MTSDKYGLVKAILTPAEYHQVSILAIGLDDTGYLSTSNVRVIDDIHSSFLVASRMLLVNKSLWRPHFSIFDRVQCW